MVRSSSKDWRTSSDLDVQRSRPAAIFVSLSSCISFQRTFVFFPFFQQRSREILSVFVFLFIPLFALEEFLFGLIFDGLLPPCSRPVMHF